MNYTIGDNGIQFEDSIVNRKVQSARTLPVAINFLISDIQQGLAVESHMEFPFLDGLGVYDRPNV